VTRLHKQLANADIEVKTKKSSAFKWLIEQTINGHFQKFNGIQAEKKSPSAIKSKTSV
jgi:hypothetical protein